MKVPLEWLREYVSIRLTPEALAERLTMAGLEVTGIERINGEPVFDLEITPNRADCLSILGVAREVAVMTGRHLKLPSAQGSGLRARGKSRKPPAPSPQPRAKLTIRIEDKKGCQRYIGRLIEGVAIGPSPEWMQRRLMACGLRPINNVVDVTNYVLLECGQPLHAFDYDRLAECTIVVRLAHPKEPMVMLDGLTRTLAPDILVIADARQAVAVAGVMGGESSAVTAQTRHLLLESALFDPITVRRTARTLGLATESSYRFERGVDPVGVDTASARAADLILSLAGGRLGAVCDVGTKPSARPAIHLDPERLSRWLGSAATPAHLRTTLARLSCRVASSDRRTTLHVTPPSFRRDLTTDVDLAEEVARVDGYDHILASIPLAPMAASCDDVPTRYRHLQELRHRCASLGLTEALTWSLVSEADFARCGSAAPAALRLSNPLSSDHAYLRPSLLIGLLQAVRRNLTQGVQSVRLFEIGSVFGRGIKPVETQRLGIILSGLWLRDWRTSQPCDFFRLKGLLEAVVQRLGAATLEAGPAGELWAEPGQSACLMLHGRPIGTAGQVARRIAHALDLEHDVWFAELVVDELLVNRHHVTSLHAPPQFPPVKRDLSVIVDDSVPCERLDAAIREAGTLARAGTPSPPHPVGGAPGSVAGGIELDVKLVDRYTGKQVPDGRHSLTFSIEYRDPSRTLTATEVDELHRRIGQTLVSRFGAQLR